MAGNFSDWSPNTNYVQAGMVDGAYANAGFTMLAAGPPRIANIGGAAAFAQALSGTGQSANQIVLPIGIVQNFNLSHTRQFNRIFEIGSERSYFITGRTVGQLGLGRIYYHGASLLRLLYAYYQDLLPPDGRMHIRDYVPRPDFVPPTGVRGMEARLAMTDAEKIQEWWASLGAKLLTPTCTRLVRLDAALGCNTLAGDDPHAKFREREHVYAQQNPRIIWFLAAHGLRIAALGPRDGHEVHYLTIGGDNMPWSSHFTQWIGNAWRTWATELGFKGDYAHEKALLGGHSANEFDDWLERRTILSNPEDLATLILDDVM